MVECVRRWLEHYPDHIYIYWCFSDNYQTWQDMQRTYLKGTTIVDWLGF